MTLQEFNALKPGSRVKKHGNKTSRLVTHIADVQYLNYAFDPPTISKYRKIMIRNRGSKPSIVIDSYYPNAMLEIDK